MAQTAQLYRMVTDEHICPFGLKSKDLLKRKGFAVEDHPLKTREETDAFKRKHGVDTTPQTFIDGTRIGGFDDLQAHFGEDRHDPDAVSYQPVIAIFAVAAMMALAASWAAFGTPVTVRAAEWFIAFSMCILAIQKLQDLEAFQTMFITYDLLAMRQLRYAKIYPFGEALAGILMISGALTWISAPVAMFIGTIGAASVIKAVYVDRRELTCACVGGTSKVPLGFISLTENLMMGAMAVWMLAKGM
ncbi:MAG: MauE/DoxX family redox-associated membrane protein [Hoeflea sp.]|uniref:MauE/DoxX family redox-associated membrane protein n=1 Tax=Hoeflea sp. TaxID=1940281 RepID=UPI00272FF01F|nr:MauE/DoxX family redox-associated membrane protein [Hoeflea sp.]MDP2121225.1 MauE/DoxX family redox-associated membrane protein [Hoeflea sp.]